MKRVKNPQFNFSSQNLGIERKFFKISAILNYSVNLNSCLDFFQRNLFKKEREAFLHEAILLRSLDHPKIVKFYATFENATQLVLITELMSEGSLSEYMTKKFQYMDQWIVDRAYLKSWCTQILMGLKYLHNQGIAHRDLKNDNFFVNEDQVYGVVKIGDVGLSRLKSASSLMHTACGTRWFWAPELFQKNPNYDEAVDRYAFGAAIFHMATGEFPYDQECSDADSLELQVTSGIPPMVSHHRIEKKLEEIIIASMSHDKKDRPSLKKMSDFFDKYE